MRIGKIIVLLLSAFCSRAQFVTELADTFPAPFRYQYQTDGLKALSFAKGTNHRVYMAGILRDSLVFLQFFDRGKTWIGTPKALYKIKNAALQPSHVSSSIACDTGQGPYKGRIYICWNDLKHGDANSDVFLIYSDDNGANWTEPVLVTYRPNHKEQFKPAMTIDSRNSRVYLLYYDRQNYTDIYNRHSLFKPAYSDIYLATTNNGLKFEYYKINQQPVLLYPGFDTRTSVVVNSQNEVGLYWTGWDGKKHSLNYKTTVNDSLLKRYNQLNEFAELKLEKTLDFAGKMMVPFSTKTNITLSAIITKPLEPGFEKIVIRDKKYKTGNNQLVIDSKALGLANDNYVLTFYYKSKNTFMWILKQE